MVLEKAYEGVDRKVNWEIMKMYHSGGDLLYAVNFFME